MSFLGNVSQNDYRFTPDSLSESFGGQNAKNLSIYYEGQEKDRFLTAFAALSAKGKVSEKVEIGFDVSGFYTNERENFDITGEYVLSNAPAGEITDALGTGLFHQHARNSLEAGVITLAHSGNWHSGNNDLKWGVSGQAELIRDHISEWEWRDRRVIRCRMTASRWNSITPYAGIVRCVRRAYKAISRTNINGTPVRDNGY